MNVRPALQALFDDVDDLIRRVADVDNPDIRQARARVYGTMVAAKSAFADSDYPRLHAGLAHAPQSLYELPDDPTEALGVALLVGLGVGFITSLEH